MSPFWATNVCCVFGPVCESFRFAAGREFAPGVVLHLIACTHDAMLNPRQRRLVADYEAIRAEFAGHAHVRVEPIGHLPPEAYRITYKLDGLRLEGDQPVVANEHVVDLRLPLGYPREQPLATPETPIFHPNVSATYCIGDYWAAGQPLADIIAKIGDMIQYRTYNVKSPLDAVAARWVADNESLFPIGTAELGTPDIEIEFKPKAAQPEPEDEEEGAPAEPDADTSDAPEANAEPAAAAAEDDPDDEFEITLKRGGDE